MIPSLRSSTGWMVQLANRGGPLADIVELPDDLDYGPSEQLDGDGRH
nr:hypothetical protein Q903MT_gene2133 [Picea sitchensis]